MPLVQLQQRDLARRRIAEIAVRYANAGEELSIVEKRYESASEAQAELLRAVASGDSDVADAALCHVLQRMPITQIASDLFDPIAASYAAAAHAPILLAELHRVAGRFTNAGLLVRAPLRYLASQPNARLNWLDASEALASESMPEEPTQLARVLSKPEAIALAEHSITATLPAPESLGRYQRDLGAFAFKDVGAVARVLLRTAAHSMLQDDAKHAPYGWTHCLTLPLALLSNLPYSNNTQRVCAMASAEVYAFRATMARVALDFNWKPEPPTHREWIAATPREAAAIVYHAPENERSAYREKLATEAAVHRDAHLAKYTLACFDAAARDPEYESLYLAAAAYLNAWWREFDAERTGEPE
ncbi:MAG: hypothetical protein EAZ24_06405 [Burkholderiales bacterium]|nr:MAG: hypothetical protein EAZ24_06405 [Burkholderiales bacterium]